MTVRFLADEDIDVDLVEGLRSREPSIDILDVKNAGLRGSRDAVLLALAAEQNRILISHDRNTMTRHFYERLALTASSPGLFIISNRPSAIGDTIAWLFSYGPHLKRRNGTTRLCTSPSAKRNRLSESGVENGVVAKTAAAWYVRCKMRNTGEK